jgi:hypothetical protein
LAKEFAIGLGQISITVLPKESAIGLRQVSISKIPTIQELYFTHAGPQKALGEKCSAEVLAQPKGLNKAHQAHLEANKTRSWLPKNCTA